MDNFFTVMWGLTDIGQLVDAITSIDRGIGSKWNNSYTAGAGRYGYKFQSNFLDSKTITINFIKLGNPAIWAAFRRQMAGILDTTTTQQLKLNDEPNVYYNAVPDGNFALTEDITTGQATGAFTFVVDDGLAHSIATNVWDSTNPTDLAELTTDPDDGSQLLTIHAISNVEVYPKLSFTMTSPNGYIGIAGEHGVMALGSQEQTIIDTTSTSKTTGVSEWLTKNDTALSNSANWTGWVDTFESSTGAPQPFHNAQNGQIKLLDVLTFGGTALTSGNTGTIMKDGLRLTSLNHDPNPTSGTWTMHAGSKYWAVPADSNGEVGAASFASYFNIFFQALKLGETALTQILYLDANKHLVCGMGLYKDDTKGNKFHIQLYIGGTNARTFRTFDNFEANNGGHGDGKVPNPNLYFNSTSGLMRIAKNGANFSWTFPNGGGQYTLHASDLASTKVAYAQIVMGNLKGRDLSINNFVQNMSVRQFRFQKTNIPKTTDASTDTTKVTPEDPNHFGQGETVIVDMPSTSIYRGDGTTTANDEMITGSQFFSLPPGDSQLTFMFTAGATPPNIKIEWEDNFL